MILWMQSCSIGAGEPKQKQNLFDMHRKESLIVQPDLRMMEGEEWVWGLGGKESQVIGPRMGTKEKHVICVLCGKPFGLGSILVHEEACVRVMQERHPKVGIPDPPEMELPEEWDVVE
eukprot:TRINITY_DN4822_c0_g1_i1.p2 TRINITY_DN4822_c0_g1~~TRINITY_DN4822_c0_g1_i1.p2  ORF type:complete len:118 (+),score=28.97 TRINITY_DN4822_c0_g1_i1:36-389(+)